jgi:hypothetical protein
VRVLVINLTGFTDVNLIENAEFMNITGFPTANSGDMKGIDPNSQN